jgi:glycosyltransferase involved in cell wall biosynthesis
VSEAKLPGISVVVTCYNCRDYIGDAIRSVARQTLRDFECVVVDDASTDDSAEVVRRTLDELGDPRFSQIRLDKNVGQTGATRRGLAATQGTFVCFLDSDDLWNPDFLERHLAAHLNESYAVGFTASNARLIDGQGKLIAGCVYWFGKERAGADRDRAFAPIDPARVPKLDTVGRSAEWQKQTPYRLYTKRVVHWVWVSTSSMMFRRSLIDLVFPEDDETFRLHMDFYVVVMAQMVAGSLLIDEALYSYRLHGRNGAADNPVLGGRLHLSSRNWGNTYAEMLGRMLSTLGRDRERFVTALGERQYRRLLLRMKAARAAWPASWLFIARSWLV